MKGSLVFIGRRRMAIFLALLGALSLPFFGVSDFRLGLASEILIFGIAASAANLLIGYAGLPTLATTAYFGVGAYVVALLGVHGITSNALVGLLAAAASAGVIGMATGLFILRTRGVAFIMITLAIAELSYQLAESWRSVTRGSDGVVGIPAPTLVPGVVLSESSQIYLYVVVLSAITIGLIGIMTRSPYGRTIAGIRENEARMRALGYNSYWFLIGVYCLSAVLAGVAGGAFVHHARFVSPGNIGFSVAALVLLMVLVGGSGHLLGGFVGAVIVIFLRDELSSRFDTWQLFLGVAFILTVYFAPNGFANVFAGRSRNGLARGVAQFRSPVNRINGLSDPASGADVESLPPDRLPDEARGGL